MATIQNFTVFYKGLYYLQVEALYSKLTLTCFLPRWSSQNLVNAVYTPVANVFVGSLFSRHFRATLDRELAAIAELNGLVLSGLHVRRAGINYLKTNPLPTISTTSGGNTRGVLTHHPQSRPDQSGPDFSCELRCTQPPLAGHATRSFVQTDV